MNKNMVTLSVESGHDAARARFGAAMKGRRKGNYILFSKASDVSRLLTENRVNLLRTMVKRGPLSMRVLAELVGRDVKAVHTDVTALVDCGVLQRSDAGVEFPFDDIHVDYHILPMPESVEG